MTDEPGFRPETLSTTTSLSTSEPPDHVAAVRLPCLRGSCQPLAWCIWCQEIDRLAARLQQAAQDLEVEREMREHADVEAETAREQRDAAEAREAARGAGRTRPR